MLKQSWLQSGTALVLGLSTVSSLVVGPWSASVNAQVRLSDIQNNWANSCIESLAERRIINGYPDGTFRPNAPVSRAEFATMLGAAFPSMQDGSRATSFQDVSRSHWAYSAIQKVAQAGFMSGYPDGGFRPRQNIQRVQALVSLSNGLNYRSPANVNAILDRNFYDANAIPSYAQTAIAAATTQRIVVNYPNVKQLNPNQNATRAEIASFLCQALKESNQAGLISGNYIAGGQNTVYLNSGVNIPVKYVEAERIIIGTQETVPLTLVTTADVRNNEGAVLIPVGSKVVGQLVPRNGGSQFVAQTLKIDGVSYPMVASSDIVTRVQNTRDLNLGSLARNTAIGGALAAGISGLAGDRTITAEKVLSGAATGAAIETNKGRGVLSILRDTTLGAAVAAGVSGLVGDRTITPQKVISGAAAGATIGGVLDRPKVDKVVIIDPNTDLSLKLDAQFAIAPQ